MKKSKKGFTLIELLVVVLIIGILAAIAVPQYRKAVLKADLHKGIPLAESIYQAQQAYRLAHGDFATDIDDLDVSIPKDENCIKTQNSIKSSYDCDFGKISLSDSFTNVAFADKNAQIGYHRYLTDFNSGNLERKAGEVWCFAQTNNNTAKAVCESMGGVFGNSTPNSWTRYKIR